jgi:hypothetical protein
MYDLFNNGMYLAYGGDWGEGNHNGSFCVDGLLQADRRIDPEMDEVKKVYQSLNFEQTSSSDLQNGIVRVRNEFYARNGNEYDYGWTLYEDGMIIGSGSLAVPSIPVMTNQVALFTIPTVALQVPYLAALPGVAKPGAEYFLKIQVHLKKAELWADKGHLIAEEQFPLTWFDSKESVKMDKNSVSVLTCNNGESLLTIGNAGYSVVFNKSSGAMTSFTANGDQLITSGPEPTFWRAPMANDRNGNSKWLNADINKTLYSFGTPVVAHDGKSVEFTVTYRLPDISTSSYLDMKYLVFGTGAIQVTTSLRTSDTTQMYRFGVDLSMPEGYEYVDWFTRGPRENLNDRLTGSFPARYATTVSDNYYSYAKPQDNGTHQDTRFMALTSDSKDTGLLIAATGSKLFEANALHIGWRDMNNSSSWSSQTVAGHPYQLKVRKETIVSVSYGSRGTGGASCGPDTLTQYMLPGGNYSYSYTLVPFTKDAEDPLDLSKYYKVAGGNYLIDMTLSDSAAGIEAVLKNNSESTVNALLILAVYNSSGKLVYTDQGEVSVATPNSSKVTFNFDRSKFAGCQYKVFAWGSQDFVPLLSVSEGKL